MGKVRDSALFNGFLIGLACGSFCVGWVGHHLYNHLAKMVSIVSQIASGDTELLRDIELLKASGDKTLLVCIIIGIVLLAVGIGREVYQRAKRQNS